MSDYLKNSNVLVTGGAGFIGSNLIKSLLNNNNNVVCLDNLSTGKYINIKEFENNENFKFFKGDIISPEDCNQAVENVEYIFHQAALGSVPRSVKNPIKTNEVNITGFLNLLSAARNSSIKRFIYASSSSVYGDSKVLPKQEDNIGIPISPYAVTKHTNEIYAKVFSNLYGIEVVGLRYFNVFGPKQDINSDYAAVIPKFISALYKNQSPVINGNGENTRDFTYVDNVVNANHLAALTNNKSAINNVFNVACGKSTDLVELFNIIKNEIQDFNPEVKNIEPEFGPLRQGDVLHSLASISKAEKLINYKIFVDVKTGLKNTVNWYINNL